MIRSHRSFFFIGTCATTIAIGCGLSFGPADFTNGTTSGEGGAQSPTEGSTTDGPPGFVLPDGAVVNASKLLVVLAGERDGTDVATSDFWIAPIDDTSGNVGAFTALQSGVFRGSLGSFAIVNGRLVVAMRSGNRWVEHMDYGPPNGPNGFWTGTAAPTPPVYSYGSVWAGSTILAVGGAYDITTDAGTNTFRDDKIRISAFAPNSDGGGGTGFTPLSESPTRTPLAIRDMQLATYKNKFVYLIGGNSSSGDQFNKVYVASVDPAKGVNDFAATTAIVNPANAQRHNPQNAMFCTVETSPNKGRLIIAGGDATDVVLSAPIDEATGMLGTWQAATKLPGALRGAGCAYFNGALHFIGGVGTTSRTDRIIRATFGMTDDGKSGEWDLSSGEKLPLPRSSIIAFVVDRATP
jgi:hypothetical protein